MAKRNVKAGKVVAKRNSAEKSAVDSMLADTGELTVMHTSNIDDKSFKNVRSEWTAKAESSPSLESKTDGGSYKETKESIRAVGQKDPVTVRRKAKVGKNGCEYELIKGFQRFRAITEIGAERKPEPDNDPLIKVIVKELDDLAAIEECTFENTARNNLNPADTAAAACRVQDAYLAKYGTPISVNQLAQNMGKNQSWLNSLMLIARRCGPAFEKWQNESVISIPTKVMTKVMQESTVGEGESATVDTEKASQLFDKVKAAGGKFPKEEQSAEAKAKEALKAATAGATAAGKLLGKLVAGGHISLTDEAGTSTGLLVSCDISLENLSTEQIRNVCNTLTAARLQAIVDTRAAAEKAGVAEPGEPVRRRGKRQPAATESAN